MKRIVFATSLSVGLLSTAVAVAGDPLRAVVWQAATDSLVNQKAPRKLDLRQGHVLADILKDRDIKSVAVTYAKSAYGVGLETAFSTAFRAQGGTVAISISHQDGKTDYFAEMGALSAVGVEHLVIFGHLDRGGEGIIRTALDTGAFDKFVLADEMVGDALVQAIGDELAGSIATVPGAAPSEPVNIPMAVSNPIDQAGTLEKLVPPADLAGAADAAKSGAAIEFDPADEVELTGIGDATGTYRELEFIDGKFETVKIR